MSDNPFEPNTRTDSADIIPTTHNDGALTDAYNGLASIQNRRSGLGGFRDQSTHVAINDPVNFSLVDLGKLYRTSRITQIAVDLIPSEACRIPVEWSIDGNPELEANLSQAWTDLDVQNFFNDAGCLGRLYGDGFLVLGINDDLEFHEPVDEANIQSIDWIEAVSYEQLNPDTSFGYRNPEYYQVSMSEELRKKGVFASRFHHSRVIRVPGIRLRGMQLQNTGGRNDSIIQAMFAEFSAFLQATLASSTMLQKHNTFVYKLRELAKLVATNGTDAILNRFLTLQLGMSVNNGMVIDAGDSKGNGAEEVSFKAQNFSGVDKILDRLENCLITATGLPRSFVADGAKAGAFSEAGESDRYMLAGLTDSYQQSHLRTPMLALGKYLLLSKSGPSGGRLPERYDLNYPSTLRLTEKEKAQLYTEYAKGDQIYIDLGTLGNKEVRESRFGGSHYGVEITLDENFQVEEYYEKEARDQAREDGLETRRNEREDVKEERVAKVQQLEMDLGLSQSGDVRTDSISLIQYRDNVAKQLDIPYESLVNFSLAQLQNLEQNVVM